MKIEKIALLLCATALCFACGGDDSEPAAQGRAMAPTRAAASPAERAQANRAPRVTDVRIEPEAPLPGQDLQVVVEAEDPDGDPIRLEYRWTLNRDEVGNRSPHFRGQTLQKGDRLEVEVVATDGLLESDAYREDVEIENRVPVVRSIAFDPHEDVKPGDEITALVDVGDHDDDPVELEYTWLVNGSETREDDRVFSTAGLRRGDKVQVRVVARDGDERSRSETSGEIELANSPPRIKGIPSPSQDGDSFKYQFEADDPDGDRSLRYSLGQSPAGMTIDPIYGIATWRPTPEQQGVQIIEVSVADNHGAGTTLRFQVSVNISGPTDPAAGSQAPAAGAAADGAEAAPAPAAQADDAGEADEDEY